MLCQGGIRTGNCKANCDQSQNLDYNRFSFESIDHCKTLGVTLTSKSLLKLPQKLRPKNFRRKQLEGDFALARTNPTQLQTLISVLARRFPNHPRPFRRIVNPSTGDTRK
jgi:hypothetical protein